MFSKNLPSVVALFSLVVVGCAADDDSDMNMHVPTPDACDSETRDDTFAVGLEKVGDKGTVVKLMTATPSPPAKGDNTWLIAVADETGVPVTDANIVVFPWMPDHGHGATVDTVVDNGGDGTYDISPINLWMPGLWEVTLDIEVASEVDQVTYAFCIEG